MKKDQIFPSKYLKEPDLRGRDVQVTIDYAERVTLNQKPSLLLHFEGKDKGLVINGTIYDQIVGVTGADDTDDWPGQKITLFPTTTEFQGKSMPVIRVRMQNAENGQGKKKGPPDPPPDVDPDEDEEDSVPF